LNRQWFDMFKSCIVGIVLMGNDARYMVVGISTIKVKIFDKVWGRLVMLDMF
jgi:hypothetical protein